MSHLLVNVKEEMEMPGGVGFIDMTDILKLGTEDMELGSLLAVSSFTLQEAMSALEIMDPRMDSGMVDPPPPFDPHMPLLPSEVCWIIDRSFACEMSWHTGLALSQTVYTLQYVHHLLDIMQPHFDSTSPFQQLNDPDRPMRLVTLVLRASVFGLVKCCDMVWRELAADNLVDGEDWNSEKFGVSLCEGVRSETLMRLLGEAVDWLQESQSLSSSPWRDPLLQRLLLRKNIFQTLAYPSFPALRAAEQNLEAILAGPSPPEPSTAVKNAFDPAIVRRLVSYVPTRIVDLPPQTEVWDAMLMWIDGWQEVRQLIGADDLRCVKVLACIRAREVQSPRRSAFVRAFSISTFFNHNRILTSHDPPWLIDRFFWEMAAVDTGILSQTDGRSSSSSCTNQRSQALPQLLCEGEKETVEIFEKGLARLLVDLISSFFQNRARQRRKLADSLLDWHLGYDQALIIAARLSNAISSSLALHRVPLCIRHTRISIITEIVFSGFELQLYNPDEWPLMYWYTGQLFATQVVILGELRTSISQDTSAANPSEAQSYLSFQLEFSEALWRFSVAMRDMLYWYSPVKTKIDALREQANFERRFKWAFIGGYAEVSVLDEDRPILEKWRKDRESSDDRLIQVEVDLVKARDALSRLSGLGPIQSGSIFCPEAHTEFILGLVKACDANLTFLKLKPEIWGTTRRDWHWRSSRWFPEVDIS